MRREDLDPVASLENRIGYQFRDKCLALRALSHRSLNSEKKLTREEAAQHNEQLEFLGDSVLGLIVSEHLYHSYPEIPEGKLSVLKARIVSAAHLVEASRGIGLGHILVLGKGEELSGGREKKALLADAIEAVLGAVYLDGGLDAARQFVRTHILEIASAQEDSPELNNFKALLQEHVQSIGLPQPVYVTVKTEGPEHAKMFTVEVRVGPEWTEQGMGQTKKYAGQMAARLLLERIRANSAAPAA